MPKLEVVNANNVIEYSPQKANFKLKNTGGPKGEPGAQGPKGDTGPQGPAGPQGIQGEKGDKGAQGERGPQGIQGPQGLQGIQGPKGDKGDKGNTGATGPQGPQGPAGQDGADGFSPIATVTQEGLDAEISITDKDGTTTATVPGFGVQVVESLPATGSSNVIYLERDSNSASGNPISIADAVEAPLKSLEIQGNTTQQTYTGKNLLKMPIVSGSSNGITWTVQDDGSIILNGTSTAGVNIKANNVTIPAVEGETYTLSATGMGEAYNFGYKKSSSGENIFVVTSASPTTTAVVTSTMLSQANRLDMYIRSGKTFNNQRVTLQLEKGSLASSFEPYTNGPAPNPDYPQAVQTVTGENTLTISDGQGNEQSYEVNLGKNLFDKSNASGLFEGYISGGKAWAASGYWSYYIPCQPNTTYTASRTIIGNGGRFTIATSQAVPANGANVAQLTKDNTATSLTITTNSSAKYIIVWFANVNDAGSESLADWEAVQQLEKGSQATSYAAYFTPIELCKIGAYQDYIYKSGDKWYVHKEVGKAELSSSWNWYYNSASHGFSVSFVAGRNWGVYAGYCSHATVQESSSAWTGVGKCGWNVSNIFWFEDGGMVATSAADFKTWLSENTPVVYYVLATPTDTEITNATLIAQLEAILAGGTQAGANTITLTPSAGATGALEVEYYDSYDSYLWVNNRWEKFAHLG